MENSNTRTLYSLLPQRLKNYWKRIENSDTGLRLVRGVFWSLTGSIISRGLMLCATIIVARMLGKSSYGEFGMIQSTVGMLGIFAGFGLSLTATKHVAEFSKKSPERIEQVIGLSSLFAIATGGMMAAILLFIAPWLAEQTINAPHLTNILRIGAIILFINALNGSQTGALAGFEAFKTIAHVNLIVGIISFPTLVIGTYLGGLKGTIWALAINLCFNWLLNHWALRREAHKHNITLSFKNCTSELPILYKFALPATLSGLMVGPANWACRAILANTTNGYDELGVVTAALVFQTLILFVTNTINAPLLSMISNAGGNISTKLSKINILSTWILGVLVAIPLLSFPEIAQCVFGQDYTTHNFKITFSLIVFCTSIMTFKTGLARILVANNLLWWGYLSNTIWAVTLIGSTIIFASLGAPGLALSLTIAYILNVIIILPLYYSRNLIPRQTLISFESAVVWSILILLLILNVLDISLLIRSFMFIPSLLAALFSFYRIYGYAKTNRSAAD